MSSFAPVRGTKSQIQATPMVDGQMLIETDQGDLNKIYIDAPDGGGVLQRTMAGGGGHQILPNPKDTVNPPTESAVVTDTNNASNTSENIASLYGMQVWSNRKTVRRIMTGTQAGTLITANGIGTWVDEPEIVEATPVGTEDPSAEGWYEYEYDNSVNPPIIIGYQLTTDVTVDAGKTYFETVPNEDDWWQDEAFKVDDSSDDVDVGLKFDPRGDATTLGGYILDTVTGRICVKFGNSVEVETCRIAIDITYTRNEIG